MEIPPKRRFKKSDGWVALESRSKPGKIYYFNAGIGKSVWRLSHLENIKDEPDFHASKQKASKKKSSQSGTASTNTHQSPSSSKPSEMKRNQKNILSTFAKQDSAQCNNQKSVYDVARSSPTSSSMDSDKVCRNDQSGRSVSFQRSRNGPTRRKRFFSTNHDRQKHNFNQSCNEAPKKERTHKMTKIDASEYQNPEVVSSSVLSSSSHRKLHFDSNCEQTKKCQEPLPLFSPPRSTVHAAVTSINSHMGTSDPPNFKRPAETRLLRLRKTLAEQRKMFNPVKELTQITKDTAYLNKPKPVHHISARPCTTAPASVASDFSCERQSNSSKTTQNLIELLPKVTAKRTHSGDEDGDEPVETKRAKESFNFTSKQKSGLTASSMTSQCLKGVSKAPEIKPLQEMQLQPCGILSEGIQMKTKISCSIKTPALSNKNQSKEQECESMDVEYSECNVILNIDKLRKSNFPKESYNRPSCMDDGMDVDILPSENKLFCVVVDTNVLISNLKTIEGLRDTMMPGKGRITLYLPWQVMQELDKLKGCGNMNLKSLARQAVKFLHDNFSSNHPHVRGQKFRDSSILECADDNILNACLDLQEQGYDVVLLSNDINFCNKALLSGVSALTKDQFIEQLNEKHKSICTSSLSNPISSESVSPLNKTLHTASCDGENEFADSMLCKLKACIKKFISEIVSFGMESEYGKLWRKRTMIPPPWEADEALRCLSKHYLPICGDTVNRSKLCGNADGLVEILKSRAKRYGIQLSDIQEALDLLSHLFELLEGKYSRITGQAMQELQNLKHTFKATSSCSKDVNYLDSTKSLFIIPSEAAPNERRVIISAERSLNERPSLVFMCFERAYHEVNELCSVNVGQDFNPAWKSKAVEMLEAVRLLVESMKSLLSSPERDLTETNPAVGVLFQLIKGNVNISERDIIDFCLTRSTRSLMEIGLSQFAVFENTLAKSCSTFQ